MFFHSKFRSKSIFLRSKFKNFAQGLLDNENVIIAEESKPSEIDESNLTENTLSGAIINGVRRKITKPILTKTRNQVEENSFKNRSKIKYNHSKKIVPKSSVIIQKSFQNQVLSLKIRSNFNFSSLEMNSKKFVSGRPA